MDKSIQEIVKEAVHKIDLIKRPYAMFINPRNKDQIEKVKREFPDLMEAYVIIEAQGVKEGDIVVVEREEMEGWLIAKPPKE